MDNQIFNVYEQVKPVNHSINLVIKPVEEITSYSYVVYKNEAVYLEKEVYNDDVSIINLSETGKFEVVVKELIGDEVKTIKSGVYNIDKEEPVIQVDEYVYKIKLGEAFDEKAIVRAYDNQDGDLSGKITSNIDELDLTTKGIKRLIYKVSDEAGNTSARAVNLNIVANETTDILLVQGVFAFALVLLLIFAFVYKRRLKIEKRVSKFAIEPIKTRDATLFDHLLNLYYRIITKIKGSMSNFQTIKKYSKRYEKYVYIANKRYEDGMDFVVSKIVIAVVFVILAIFSKAIKNDLLRFYEIGIPLLAGFYVPDIVYRLSFKKYKSSLENDLLQAVMIMNNAFKSGRSITQAIDLVTTELTGPVSEQFKKLAMEIKLGLGVEEAFRRLEERLPLESVSYLTASISILNKTGGNIIKVFTSIEKTLFNKKRLRLELKSLTGSSRIISYMLIAVPILFVIFVSVLDSTYFVPFFTSTIGIILLIVMIVIYVVYVIFVTRMMKVKV